MSNLRAVALPGLAMTAAEIPAHEGLLRLENAELGKAARRFDNAYTLEDLAESHLASLRKAFDESPNAEWIFMGMSLGGMIVALLASKFRSRLPPRSRFVSLVSSPNSRDLPALPAALVETWAFVRLGSFEDFKKAVEPFFSKQFRETHPREFEAYARYRAEGGNGQGGRAFSRQLKALSDFHLEDYLPQIDPLECVFVGGEADEILGPPHNRRFRELLPEARHVELAKVGHMINIEAPRYFDPALYSSLNFDRSL